MHGRELAVTGWFTTRLQSKSPCLAEAARHGAPGSATPERIGQPAWLFPSAPSSASSSNRQQAPNHPQADLRAASILAHLIVHSHFPRGEAIEMYDE